jgi:hypothetical protein
MCPTCEPEQPAATLPTMSNGQSNGASDASHPGFTKFETKRHNPYAPVGDFLSA